ncbi:MAG TPA: PqqD family protein [Pyrinomonadaceae bacterium]|jgi:hypothetical protein
MTTDTPTPPDHIISTELDDGEGVLVDLNSKRYYQLNETAMFIWKRLEKGQPLPEIIDDLTESYDVSPEHAARSIETLLENLQSRKLVNPRQTQNAAQ